MRSLLLVALLAFPLAAAAQTPTRAIPARTLSAVPDRPDTDSDKLGNFEIQDLMSRFNSAEVIRHDARRASRSVLERDGLRRVAVVRGGPTLFASVANGRVADWVFIGQNGQVMGPQTLRVPGDTQGETTCWKCGATSGGDVHCWQVECPVIVSNSGGNTD